MSSTEQMKCENRSRKTVMKIKIVNTNLIASLMLLAAPAVGFADTEIYGKDLYTMYCTQCHGVNGDGQGVNAASMSVQPRSHIEKEEMAQRLDEELYKVIEQGGVSINKSVLMPAWKDNLSPEQINALVAYLRKLCCEE